MCTQEHKPIPKPRQMKRPSEVSCSGQDSYKPPMQETCRPAQTLTSYLNRADMAHLRQQSTPLVDQRGIVFPKTRRYAKPPATESNSSSHSQSTPFSPALEKDSAHPKPPTKPGNVETSLSSVVLCEKYYWLHYGALQLYHHGQESHQLWTHLLLSQDTHFQRSQWRLHLMIQATMPS